MDDKELVWLHGEIKTPPFTQEARTEAGFLLRVIAICKRRLTLYDSLE